MLAHLLLIEGQPCPIVAIPSLVNPTLVRMTKSGFVLRGVQFASPDGLNRIPEVVQEWWATPIHGETELPKWMRSTRTNACP